MKLAFLRLSEYFGYAVSSPQQIADNTSLSVEEVLSLDEIVCDNTCTEYLSGLIETNPVQAKINGAGNVKYWKGVLNNAC